MPDIELMRLEKASVNYGSTAALRDIDLTVKMGEAVALVGANGAGKSTVMRAIFGLAQIAAGKIFWRGQEIFPLPHEMAERRVVFVPQGRRVFPGLTVLDNLNLGGIFINNRIELAARITEVFDFFSVLAKKKDVKAGRLSGGEQQMLALGRAMVAKPDLMLLDEPSLGLAPKALAGLFEKIREINLQRKTTILVAEHKIGALKMIASRGYLLDQGRIIAGGPVETLTINRS